MLYSPHSILSRSGQVVSIEEEREAAQEAQTAMNALSAASVPSPNIVATLRNAKYKATVAMMTTLSSETLLNDARHTVGILLSDLIHALGTGRLTQGKIVKAKGAIEDWKNRLETQR